MEQLSKYAVLHTYENMVLGINDYVENVITLYPSQVTEMQTQLGKPITVCIDNCE